MNAGVDEALPRSEDTDSQQDPRAGLSTEEVQDGEAVDHPDSDDEMDPDRIDSALRISSMTSPRETFLPQSWKQLETCWSTFQALTPLRCLCFL